MPVKVVKEYLETCQRSFVVE